MVTAFRASGARPHSTERPLSVFELGTQSLKLHAIYNGTIYTEKYQYTLGHEVYSSGSISPSTVQHVVSIAKANQHWPTIAIGTGAVRDAENRAELLQELQPHLELGARVLTPWEEASLLAVGYLDVLGRLPGLVADIGGGSTQLVFLSRRRNLAWSSLPVGAIRLHYSSRKETNDRLEWIDAELKKAPVMRAEQLFATGGTAKTITRCIGKQAVSRKELEDFERRVRTDGPPADLRAARAVVLHEGLLLATRLLEYVEARWFCYLPLSVGRTYLACAAQQDLSRRSADSA